METRQRDRERELHDFAKSAGRHLVENGLQPAPGLMEDTLSLDKGLAGQLLFLVDLYRCTNEETLHESIEGGLEKLVKRMETEPSLNYGLMSGRSGIALLCWYWYHISREDKWLAHARDIMQGAEKGYLDSDDTCCGYADGLAGCLAVLSLTGAFEDEALMKVRDDQMGLLLKLMIYGKGGLHWPVLQKHAWHPTNLKEGTSGISICLASLRSQSKDSLAVLLEGIRQYEHSFRTGEGVYKNLIMPGMDSPGFQDEALSHYRAGNKAWFTGQPMESGWLKGHAGIALARLVAVNTLEGSSAAAFETDLQRLEQLLEEDGQSGDSLSQPGAGYAVYLTEKARYSGRTEDREGSLPHVWKLVQEAEANPGSQWLTGRTGIAHLALSALYPNKTISLFTLDLPADLSAGRTELPSLQIVNGTILQKKYPVTCKVAAGTFPELMQKAVQATTNPIATFEKKIAEHSEEAQEPHYEHLMDAFTYEQTRQSMRMSISSLAWVDAGSFNDFLASKKLLNGDRMVFAKTPLLTDPEADIHTMKWDWHTEYDQENRVPVDVLENLKKPAEEHHYLLKAAANNSGYTEMLLDQASYLILHTFREPKSLMEALPEMHEAFNITSEEMKNQVTSYLVEQVSEFIAGGVIRPKSDASAS